MIMLKGRGVDFAGSGRTGTRTSSIPVPFDGETAGGIRLRHLDLQWLPDQACPWKSAGGRDPPSFRRARCKLWLLTYAGW